MLRTVEDIGDIPIVFEPDRPILLRDVSTSLDDAVIQKSQVRVNGKQQVCVLIYRQQEARSLNLAEGVKSAIPEMESELPEGSKLEFVIDQTKYVRKAIESLVHEGFIVAILVSYMILVFLDNWRMTVIATIALLLSILGAIIMVPLLRSFVMPTIIMAAVPLGLIGVLTMLWLPECLPSFAASVPRKEARRHRDDRRLTSMRR